MKSKITKYILKLSEERDYALSEITNHVCVDDKKSMCKGCYENDFDQSGNKAWSEIFVTRKLKRE